jgi:hypothetical protein
MNVNENSACKKGGVRVCLHVYLLPVADARATCVEGAAIVRLQDLAPHRWGMKEIRAGVVEDVVSSRLPGRIRERASTPRPCPRLTRSRVTRSTPCAG